MQSIMQTTVNAVVCINNAESENFAVSRILHRAVKKNHFFFIIAVAGFAPVGALLITSLLPLYQVKNLYPLSG